MEVMIWASLSWYSSGPKFTQNGWITSSDYMDILCNQVHGSVLFPNSDAVFQDDSPYT